MRRLATLRIFGYCTGWRLAPVWRERPVNILRRLPFASERCPHRIVTPYAEPATMAVRASNVQVSLDDRIEILNRNAAEASQAKKVFRTVSTILGLVRVRSVVLRSLVDSISHR